MRISDWSSDVCSSDLFFRRQKEERCFDKLSTNGVGEQRGGLPIEQNEPKTQQWISTTNSAAISAPPPWPPSTPRPTPRAPNACASTLARSAAPRVGKGCVRKFRYRGAPQHKKKN